MKKTSKSNETRKVQAAEFKKRYAEVSAKAKAVKAKLKEALKDAKELSKAANSLYDFGNDRLYAEGDPMIYPAFRGLGDKMDQLKWWADSKFAIAHAAEDL